MDPLLLIPANTTRSSRYDIINYIELNTDVGMSTIITVSLILNVKSYPVYLLCIGFIVVNA
jgi:hypothetical protein